MRLGIDTVLITDSTAGSVLRRGDVQAVIVGADRIAANGDTANKVGTYPLAVLAHRHEVPFYVAAPLSTIDASIPDGGHIPIEERDAAEVTHFAGVRIAPPGVGVYAPAFDVTPAELVSAIITERGILRPPYGASLAGTLRGRGETGTP
jgi:methylthioribose-1-phosphate isomerase